MVPRPDEEAEAWRTILDYADAKPAIDKLCAKECDQQRLERYVLSVWRELKPKKHPARPDPRRRYEALVRQLRELSNSDKLMDDMSIDRLDGKTFEELLLFLPELFELLERAVSVLEKATRLPRARRQRYPSILLLLEEVKRRTLTHRYHYADVVKLTNAASWAAGSKKQFDEPALRNMIRRQRKRLIAQT